MNESSLRALYSTTSQRHLNVAYSFPLVRVSHSGQGRVVLPVDASGLRIPSINEHLFFSRSKGEERKGLVSLFARLVQMLLTPISDDLRFLPTRAQYLCT